MEYTNMLVGDNRILTPTDVKEILKIGRNAVYDYLKDGTIRSMMIAGKYRIQKLYLLEFMYPDVDFVKEAS